MARSAVKFNLSAEDKTKRAFSGALGNIKRLSGAFTGLMGPIAAVGGVAGLGMLIKKTAETGDMFDKMSKRIGVSVETLSQWKFIAERSGSSIAAIEKSMKYLTSQMLDVSRGTGESIQTFEELGIQVTDTEGRLRSVDTIFMEAAQRIAAIDEPTRQAAYAMELFGARAGQELVPMLALGEEGIKSLTERSREIGAVWSTEDATAAAEFTDAMTDMKTSMESLTRIAGTSLFPVLTDLADATATWIGENRDFIELKVDEYVGNIDDVLDSLAEHKDTFDVVFGGVAQIAENLITIADNIGFVVSHADDLVKFSMNPQNQPAEENPYPYGNPNDPKFWSDMRGMIIGAPKEQPVIESEIKPNVKLAPMPELAIEQPGVDQLDYMFADRLEAEKRFNEERRNLWARGHELEIMLATEGVEQQKELLKFRFQEEYGMMDEHDERRILAEKNLYKEIELLNEDAVETMSLGWVSLSNQISDVLANSAMESENVFESIEKAFSRMLLNMAAQLAAKSAVFGVFSMFGGAGLLGGSLSKFLFPSFAGGSGDIRNPMVAVIGDDPRGPERVLNAEQNREWQAMKSGAATSRVTNVDSVNIHFHDKAERLSGMARIQLGKTISELIRTGEIDMSVAMGRA